MNTCSRIEQLDGRQNTSKLSGVISHLTHAIALSVMISLSPAGQAEESGNTVSLYDQMNDAGTLINLPNFLIECAKKVKIDPTQPGPVRIGKLRRGGGTFVCDNPSFIDPNITITGGLPQCADGSCSVIPHLYINKEGSPCLMYFNGRIVEVEVKERIKESKS